MAFNAISFNNVSSAVYGNRYQGGSNLEKNSHPFIKGYFYVLFEFPDIFEQGDQTALTNLLLSSAESYTPPGDRQLKTEEVMGMGGVDSTFVTGQQIDRNFSVQYKEYWGAPIFRIHRQWTSIIDPYSGGAIKKSETDAVSNFEVQSYKGRCWVIQTKPVLGNNANKFTLDDIIKVDFMDGVFPRTDLKSIYDSNITDNSLVRPNIQYSFDGFPLDETNDVVKKEALDKLNAVLVIDDTLSKHSYNVFDQLTGE
jgi:hypothetical protein